MKLMVKLFLLLGFISSFIVAEPTFPNLSGRVVDNASLLSSSKAQELTTLLKEHEDKTTNQIVIVTLKSLQGYEIAEYGYQLGRHWGIGQKGKDNGILLIIAPNERKVRIEVGYGLEGVVTDKIAYDIIQEKIIPFFKNKDYSEGIEQGTYAILQALDGTYVIVENSKVSQEVSGDNEDYFGVFLFVVFILSIVVEVIISDISSSKRLLISVIVATIASFVAWSMFWSVMFTIIVWIFTAVQLFGLSSSAKGGYRSSGSYSSGSSFSGFSSSSGGFSGGGGSFGGGGSSGSW